MDKYKVGLANKPVIARVEKPVTTKGRKKSVERLQEEAGLDEYYWELENLGNYDPTQTRGTV